MGCSEAGAATGFPLLLGATAKRAEALVAIPRTCVTTLPAGVACDVSEPASVEQLVGEAAAALGGGIDVWVNNAGYSGSFQVSVGIQPRRACLIAGCAIHCLPCCPAVRFSICCTLTCQSHECSMRLPTCAEAGGPAGGEHCTGEPCGRSSHPPVCHPPSVPPS